MLWTEGFLHHIQDSATMKTFIVLCSLATIAIAIPTIIRENFDSIVSSQENTPELKIREKKSLLYDPLEERSLDDGRENTQIRHSQKTEVGRPSSGNTRVGLRKPIIIKKKFGYHVYRDSDEEMAHADPNENCRKQFKVKLCDNELLLHTDSNNVEKILSEHEIISDKEIGNNVKIAKAAVENLERSLQKKEHSARKSNSKEDSESDITLHKDIEMAKSALEHIQKNMGNLESLEVQVNNQEKKEFQHLNSINKWKEAMDNIHKNVETPKNFEDTFKIDKQNFHNSENINIQRMSEHGPLDEQSKNSPQTILPTAKAMHEDNSNSHELSSKSKTSSTKDEQDMNEDNDMFVSPTDHKDSKIKLHSESLTSENVFDKKSSLDYDTESTNLNTENQAMATKNSEILAQDSDLEHMKMANNVMQKPDTKAAETTMQQNAEKSVESDSQAEYNNLNTISNNKHTNSLGAKSTEHAESKKLTKDIKSAMSSDQSGEEKRNHNPEVKYSEINSDQINTETKILGDKKLSTEIDPTKRTEQRNTEHPSKESMDVLPLTHPKMNLLKEKEAKDEEKLEIDNDPLHKNRFESHVKASLIDNKERDLTKKFNSHIHKASGVNTDMSTLTAVEPLEEHIPNKISTMRLTEDHNMEHLHNENHETSDFHSKHFIKENDHTSSRMNKDPNMEEQLNDFHKSFMRLAEEKRLNDIFTQQLHTASGPNEFYNEHQLPTNMRFSEGHNDENMGHALTESQNLNNLQLAERWAHKQQQQDSHAFRTVSEFRNADMLVPMTKANEFHNGQHVPKEQTNMRIADDQNLRQLFSETHELHDPHLMHWSQEKHHNDDLAQMFDTEGEYHNEPHLNDHLYANFYPPTSVNRFSNHFDIDSNHGRSSMGSTMPDHFHILKHAKSNDMDSAMQPSMHIPMRDSPIQMGHHHHHHGMARSSYSPSQTHVGANSGAVGVFSNANTGCGIPLLVSCSPSVVSGSLTRAQPIGMSAPAYRAADNFMYYMKRDTNKIEGPQNVKLQKTPIHAAS